MIKEQTKRRLILILIISLISISIAFIFINNSASYFGYFYSLDEQKVSTSSVIKMSSDAPQVIIGNVHIPVDLATTNAQIQKGLSGRPSLPTSNGMLFIFSKPSIYSFWMPDMNFPLDIIWINNGKVVDISHNVSNNFDPSNPVYYKPREPAQYIIEVNANFTDGKNIKIGDTVTFENIPLKP